MHRKVCSGGCSCCRNEENKALINDDDDTERTYPSQKIYRGSEYVPVNPESSEYEDIAKKNALSGHQDGKNHMH